VSGGEAAVIVLVPDKVIKLLEIVKRFIFLVI